MTGKLHTEKHVRGRGNKRDKKMFRSQFDPELAANIYRYNKEVHR
jgi:hypothetical protein